jgi:streptomycin 6-kinase
MLLGGELRMRLTHRYGPEIDRWLDELPPVLDALVERWQLELDSVVQRGTISVVIRCRTADGRSRILKLSPDRARIVDEATALARWRTPSVPAVLAVDETVGALLIEAIEPGIALDESGRMPTIDELASLIRALHVDPRPTDMPFGERIDYFFEQGLRDYERGTDATAIVPRDLFERGRLAAERLAESTSEMRYLHGDLTAVNVLDGGPERGLVAIDPAPCVGDPAFDAVDLLFWGATDVGSIVQRAQQLGPVIDADPERLLRWCAAFAPMVALETAVWSPEETQKIDALRSLAALRLSES